MIASAFEIRKPAQREEGTWSRLHSCQTAVPGKVISEADSAGQCMRAVTQQRRRGPHHKRKRARRHGLCAEGTDQLWARWGAGLTGRVDEDRRQVWGLGKGSG